MIGVRALMEGQRSAIDVAVEAIDQMILGNFSDTGALQDTPPVLRKKLTLLRESFVGRLKAARDFGEKDMVTGLLTRSAFRLNLIDRLDHADVGNGVAVFFCNVDGFRRINAMLGTAGADRLLAQVAMRIRFAVAAIGIAQERWIIGRMGSDEIAFYVEQMDVADASRCARAVQSALAEPFFVEDQALTASVSIGIVCETRADISYDMMMRFAEQAMRRAKLSGGGVRLFDDREQARAEAMAAIEIGLDHALPNEEFYLLYQPQVCARHVDQVVGVEALVRWQHPELGPIGPDVFIPMAERRGLIAKIGRWVIANALIANARWREKGIACRVAVNLSPVELLRDDLVGYIHEWLTRTGVPPSMLEVEVTESTAFAADGVACAQLATLRSLGVGVAIDDFGSGYSNLSRLTELPVDRLKIDRSLLAGILEREDRRMVLTGIVGLAGMLGLTVVLEGVECPEHVALLKAMNCDILQGFGIAPPLDEQALLAWLADRSVEPSERH